MCVRTHARTGMRVRVPQTRQSLSLFLSTHITQTAGLRCRADANKNGVLELHELQDILREASKEYSHFEEHSRFLDSYAPATEQPVYSFQATFPNMSL